MVSGKRLGFEIGNGVKGHVLITGASSGIGRGVAESLARRGYSVFAGVRRAQDGAELEKTPGIRAILLDVTNPEQRTDAFRTVEAAVGADGLRALVNNAGVNSVCAAEFFDETEARRMFDVNFWGVAACSSTFLPLLRIHAKRHPGAARILNVSSIGGVSGVPFIAFYNASNFAVLGYSDALRQELRPHGIAVSAILPGGVKSEIWRKTDDSLATTTSAMSERDRRIYSDRLTRFAELSTRLRKFAVTPVRAAETFVRVIENRNPRLKYFIGTDAHIMAAMARFFPDAWRHGITRSQLGG